MGVVASYRLELGIALEEQLQHPILKEVVPLDKPWVKGDTRHLITELGEGTIIIPIIIIATTITPTIPRTITYNTTEVWGIIIATPQVLPQLLGTTRWMGHQTLMECLICFRPVHPIIMDWPNSRHPSTGKILKFKFFLFTAIYAGCHSR